TDRRGVQGALALSANKMLTSRNFLDWGSRLTFGLAVAAASAQTIRIDLHSKTSKRSTMWNFSVGSDRAKIFLRDEHQRDLKVLQSAVGFRYLRCHGIFNQEMEVVTRMADGSLR